MLLRYQGRQDIRKNSTIKQDDLNMNEIFCLTDAHNTPILVVFVNVTIKREFVHSEAFKSMVKSSSIMADLIEY